MLQVRIEMAIEPQCHPKDSERCLCKRSWQSLFYIAITCVNCAHQQSCSGDFIALLWQSLFVFTTFLLSPRAKVRILCLIKARAVAWRFGQPTATKINVGAAVLLLWCFMRFFCAHLGLLQVHWPNRATLGTQPWYDGGLRWNVTPKFYFMNR